MNEKFTVQSLWSWVILDAISDTQTVPFTLRVNRLPETENNYFICSPNSSREEIMFYTTTTGTAWGEGSITVTRRGISKVDDTDSTSNNREHLRGVSEFRLHINHVIINEKANKTDLASNNNWEWASTIWIEDPLSLFTATTVEKALEELAQWAPWVADASETVAGKVEISTQTEFNNGTDTWSTGAFNVVRPSQIRASLNAIVSEAQTDNTIAESDEFIFDDWTRKRITKANLRGQILSSETERGFVERATETEATDWTDTERYITPAHVFSAINVSPTISPSSTSSSSYVTLATYTATRSQAFRVRYQARKNWGSGVGRVRLLMAWIELTWSEIEMGDGEVWNWNAVVFLRKGEAVEMQCLSTSTDTTSGLQFNIIW